MPTNKLFSDVKGTIEEKAYRDALQEFLDTNAADLSEAMKISVVDTPDGYVYFSSGEDGIEVTMKQRE